MEYFKPDMDRVRVAYDVNKHKLVTYDRHTRNGDVMKGGKVIGNTNHGDMITGIANINKIVFR